MAAATNTAAALVIPLIIPMPPRMSRPPPMKPTPVTMPAMACGDVLAATAVIAAAPSPTREKVRSPAADSRISRSKPMANVSPNAVAMRPASSRSPSPAAMTEPLPAPLGQLGLDGGAVEAPHGVTETPADLGHDAGIAVVGGGLDDGPPEAGRVGALEDARTHEDRFGAELHHE